MKIDKILQKISKEDIEEVYLSIGLSKEKSAKELGICVNTFNKLLDFYGICKSDEQIKEDKSKSLKEKLSKGFLSVIENISREELFDAYIVQNNSYNFIKDRYGLTEYMLDKVLKYYGIHKDRKQSSSLVLETKYKEFGSKEAYDKHAYNKAVETITKNGKSLDEHYSDVSEKVKDTYIKKYGSRNFYNKEKLADTCLQRYGVKAPCQLPQARMHGNNSSPNNDFAKLLESNGISYEREFPLLNYSYDFKIGNILIEINPTITHNSTWSPFGRQPLNKFYHRDKTECAKRNGFRCINVFDWDGVDKIIKLLIKGQYIGARECELREVGIEESIDFLNKYHLQNSAKSSIQYGLYYNDELISLMTFDKPRYNKNYDFEIVRYCSSCNIRGGAEKLFKHFRDNFPNCSVISYCDDSKFTGETYKKLGFSFSNSKTSKHWYNIKTKQHITDNLLRQRGFDQLFNTDFGKGTSNTDLMLNSGFVEVYDAGQSVYVYKNCVKI